MSVSCDAKNKYIDEIWRLVLLVIIKTAITN
jgi:hypothetical protein